MSHLEENTLARLESTVSRSRAFNSWFRRFWNSPSALSLMYLPVLILFAIFIVYPFIQGIKLSTTNWDGFSPTYTWVDLQQYQRMLNDRIVGQVVINTFFYGGISTLLQNLFGLAYALFLDQKLRGKDFIRAIVYLPVIISPLIMGYIFYFMFQYDGGAINDILALSGREPVDWLATGGMSVPLITLVNSYQYMGVAMVIYLAGLQTIPREYYEAASIDGASNWNRFTSITLPLLSPAITVNIVINLIGGLKLFDVIEAMTKGGPGYSSQSLSTMMYTLYFDRQDAGYAAAIGILMFVIITIVGIGALLTLRRREVDQ
jgi:raffinose/stachyose/melibiose transport system permease protein